MVVTVGINRDRFLCILIMFPLQNVFKLFLKI